MRGSELWRAVGGASARQSRAEGAGLIARWPVVLAAIGIDLRSYSSQPQEAKPACLGHEALAVAELTNAQDEFRGTRRPEDWLWKSL